MGRFAEGKQTEQNVCGPPWPEGAPAATWAWNRSSGLGLLSGVGAALLIALNFPRLHHAIATAGDKAFAIPLKDRHSTTCEWRRMATVSLPVSTSQIRTIRPTRSPIDRHGD